jgi:hypothetical protein
MPAGVSRMEMAADPFSLFISSLITTPGNGVASGASRNLIGCGTYSPSFVLVSGNNSVVFPLPYPARRTLIDKFPFHGDCLCVASWRGAGRGESGQLSAN